MFSVYSPPSTNAFEHEEIVIDACDEERGGSTNTKQKQLVSYITCVALFFLLHHGARKKKKKKRVVVMNNVFDGIYASYFSQFHVDLGSYRPEQFLKSW